MDDGPQFVIKLVVVVLYGIGIGKEKGTTSSYIGKEQHIDNLHIADDIIFTLSMVTSFLSMIYFGLTFNEQNSSRFTRMLICFPMFAAFAGARAFTLSVFLKETLGNTKEALGGVGVLAAFCAFNIICYKYENNLCTMARWELPRGFCVCICTERVGPD